MKDPTLTLTVFVDLTSFLTRILRLEKDRLVRLNLQNRFYSLLKENLKDRFRSSLSSDPFRSSRSTSFFASDVSGAFTGTVLPRRYLGITPFPSYSPNSGSVSTNFFVGVVLDYEWPMSGTWTDIQVVVYFRNESRYFINDRSRGEISTSFTSLQFIKRVSTWPSFTVATRDVGPDRLSLRVRFLVKSITILLMVVIVIVTVISRQQTHILLANPT